MTELESYAKAIAKKLKPAMDKAEEPKAQRDIFGTVRAVGSGDNVSYEVMLDGSDSYTPCTPTVEVHAGDRVVCHIVNHRLIAFSNLTVPSVNDQGYQHVKDIAVEANELLDGVSAAAASADKSLAEIIADSVTANGLVGEIETYVGYAEGYTQTLADKVDEAAQAAEQATEDAADAKEAAEQAAQDASDAAASASAAATSASSAQASATSAASSASSAQTSASNAATSASSAATSASNASTSASQAATSASNAATSASNAATSAYNAADSAAHAAQDAQQANQYSNAALDQLGVVQDVIGVLTWASEHGSFELTQDSEIVDGKVYFTYDSTSGDYTPVVVPQASALSTYYELTVDEAMESFIMSHLAVTSRGLWVLPNGINSGSVTPAQGETLADARARLGSNYKVLLANDGMYVYDGAGVLVAQYKGDGISYAEGRPFHIGNNDAYILYEPPSGLTPGKITIGGSNVLIGSNKTLSQLIGDVSSAVSTATNAASDASNAVQTANDVPIVTLSSTNGTVFKRNLGVSTTIVATIFTPGGRIDNATELRRRFGNGAYLEWGWRDVVTDADHVLVNTDPRIGNGGFTLTVDPSDIDMQAVITCTLNY